MIKKIVQLLKELYIKIKCAFCCRSNCSVQIGNENNNENENENQQ